MVERGEKFCLEAVAHRGETGGFGFQFSRGDFAGCAQANDAGDVERAGAHAAFVAAAIDLRGELHAWVAPAHVKRAAALGAVELVRGQ